MTRNVPVCAYKWLGVILILVGLCLFAASVNDWILSTCSFNIKYISSGIWAGIPCIMTGTVAVAASKRAYHSLFATHLCLAVITGLATCGPTVFGAIGLKNYLGEERGYVLSDNPLQLCEGIVTTMEYFDYCGVSCCNCNYELSNLTYTYNFLYDFRGESTGIAINSALMGLGILALIVSCSSAALFCKSTTCCPKSEDRVYLRYGGFGEPQYHTFINPRVINQD